MLILRSILWIQSQKMLQPIKKYKKGLCKYTKIEFLIDIKAEKDLYEMQEDSGKNMITLQKYASLKAAVKETQKVIRRINI